MTILIRRVESGHRRICNARCYNAKGSKCKCVCDGMNHGAGETQAIIATARSASRLLGEQDSSSSLFVRQQLSFLEDA